MEMGKIEEMGRWGDLSRAGFSDLTSDSMVRLLVRNLSFPGGLCPPDPRRTGLAVGDLIFGKFMGF
jgi:hypothetical protein